VTTGGSGDRPGDVRVAGVVLAAGAGTRFGGPKALARLDGERLVDRAVTTLRAGGCTPVLVVQGAADVGDVDATVVDNPDWAGGMGSSLRVALRRLTTDGASAAVVLLVDTPWVGPDAVARLVAASSGGCAAAQATYAGRPGHPVLLARGTWDEVTASATGDRGARAWLRAHRDLVLDVPCDVDVPADLEPRAGTAAAQSGSDDGPAAGTRSSASA
jgi:CTP:molybdopterin cytidylyltransferase MocA